MTKKSKASPVSTGTIPSRREGEKMYWLFKSEPDVFSWDDLVARGERGEPWDGVRNYLARNHMRAMRLGDLAFFYHSNIGLEIVGVCSVVALAHPDATDESGKWECVDVRAVTAMPRPVTLASVKAEARLAGMSLVTSMRLSVQPVRAVEWERVCRMGGLEPNLVEGVAAPPLPTARGKKAAVKK